MAVLTPRLVLVCAVPAVVTLLTILWTRRRRKTLTIRQAATERTSLPLAQETKAEESIELLDNLLGDSAVFENKVNCGEIADNKLQSNQNKSSEDFEFQQHIISEEVTLNSKEVRLATESAVDEVIVQREEITNLLEALQQPLNQDNQLSESSDESQDQQHLIAEHLEEVQETLPKMHVKSEENQLSAKMEQECHLSPQGGSTSDLSDRQNSPVNSDASFCDVHEDTKTRRNRGSCRLSEESRDSAMGGEEDLSIVDGPICALLQTGPSASFPQSRTDFGQELVLPELQQPVNGESGCFNDLDEVLESPPPSIYSDGHSEGSCDSGKGGSDIQVISSSDLAQLSENALLVYEFELAQDLCGRLIGRLGKHVNYIKSSSNANVFIKRHPFNARLKLCAVHGTKSEIKNALDLIRKRFPLSQYPALSLVQVNLPLTCGVMVPETLQLHLPEGVTCDVILSSMVSAGHFFVQQPTHPTYPSLNRLDSCMTSCYSQMDTPQLPQPVEVGVICACPVLEGWFRAQVVNLYESTEECDVKFVDYGGYSCIPMSRLRQIRSDFMTLPFQASECYLANVKPTSETWSLEACATFEELAQGQILQSLVVGHAEDGIPYVHLYRVQGVSTVFINRELVNRGVAQWLEAEM